MADNEGEEKTTRGTEWEVVSLTASTYAAAPGPREVELKDDDDEGNVKKQDEAETSHALFMSGHFVFPPSQHENLPLEPDYGEIKDESGGKDLVSEVTVEEGVKPSGKDEENWPITGLDVPEELAGIQYLDEKINRLSVQGKQYDEGTTLQDFSLINKEESIYEPAKYSSLHSEIAFSGETAYSENIVLSGTSEPAEQGSNVSSALAQSKNFSTDDKDSASNLPCGAWWKRRAASLYAHAKETSAFWSIFIAAAVMGLVMLGQRWQQERALQLNWQISVNNEARRRMLSPIIRLKDVIVGGHRRGSFIRRGSSGES